jgi:hypothetical protein
MKNIALLLFGLLSTQRLAAQDPSGGIQAVDTITINNVVVQLNAAREQAEERGRELQQQRQVLEQALAAAGDVASLRQAVQRLEAVRMADSAAKAKHIDDMYDLGKDVIRDMYMALGAVNSIHGALRVEQQLNLATNIWADSDLRNAWDWVGDAGTVLGTGFALFGITNDNEQIQQERIAIGLSTLALSRISSMILGATGKLDLQEKARFIDLTRIAYDDLRSRADVTQSYIAKNQEFRTNLQSFQQRYIGDEFRNNKAAAIAELNAYVIQFQTILQQVPEVVALYRATVSRYRAYIAPQTEELAAEQRQLRDDNRNLAAAIRRVEEALAFVSDEYTNQFVKHLRNYAAVQAAFSSI